MMVRVCFLEILLVVLGLIGLNLFLARGEALGSELYPWHPYENSRYEDIPMSYGPVEEKPEIVIYPQGWGTGYGTPRLYGPVEEKPELIINPRYGTFSTH